ncbi:MAG: hypothetical protein H7831_05415 [Magnetococcus sp. WYHC-3]
MPASLSIVRSDSTPSNEFHDILQDAFSGVIRLDDLDRLGAVFANGTRWYLVDPEKDPDSAREVSGPRACQHLNHLVEEILREEKGVWSTMVYAHKHDDPRLIKVFHPRRAGCGCGGSGGIVPWWVISRVPPAPVPEWQNKTSCATPGAAPTGRVGGASGLLRALFR